MGISEIGEGSMSERMGLNVYKDIRKTVLDRRFLKVHGFKRDRIAEYVNDVHFIDTLNTLLDQKDFSCKGTLQLFAPLLNRMAQDHEPEDWLAYIYQFALNQSFPSAVTVELNPQLKNPCVLYLEVLKVILNYQKKSDDKSFQSVYPFYF